MTKAKAPAPPELLEVNGTTYEIRSAEWGKLGVGSILLDSSRRRWTCIAMAQPQQFEYGKTCWLKFQAPNGEEFNVPPRYVNFRCRVLVDPTAPPIEPAWPDGAAEAWLLAQELGAEEIATQDKRTGEVWCPDYIFDTGIGLGLPDPEPDIAGRTIEPFLRHLEVCHGVDTAGLRAIEPWDAQSMAAHTAHDEAHKHPVGGAGFTHRHMPEDHSIL